MSRAASRPLDRKQFLRVTAVVVGGLAVTGCDVGTDRAGETLGGFIELSRIVTGVSELPVALAPRYLDDLEQAPLPMAPSTLVRVAGYADGIGPATLDELEASSALSRPGARACVDAIAAAWWSGTTPTRGGGRRVVTYVDALVWHALPHAQPPSNCLGATGAWSRPGAA